MTHGKVVVVYQAADGAIALRSDRGGQTLLVTQAQMAAIFGVKVPAISKHLTNIYTEGELERRATVSILETVQIENGRSVRRKIEVFDLDAVISVGYRVSSKAGTNFRKWATKTLREHVTKGFTINRRRIAKNHEAFIRAVESVRALVPTGSPVESPVLGWEQTERGVRVRVVLAERGDPGCEETYAECAHCTHVAHCRKRSQEQGTNDGGW